MGNATRLQAVGCQLYKDDNCRWAKHFVMSSPHLNKYLNMKKWINKNKVPIVIIEATRVAFFVLFLLCISGGCIAAGPAGAAEERDGAERRDVPELVTGDWESEKQAGHCFCSLSVPGSTGRGGLTLILLFTCQDDLISFKTCLFFDTWFVTGLKMCLATPLCWHEL